MTTSVATLEGRETNGRSHVLDLPVTELPAFSRVPDPGAIWTRSLLVVWALIAYFLLDELTWVFMEYWYLESFSLQSVFWTNFSTGATVFAITLAVYAAAIAAPAFIHPVPAWARKATVHIALMMGMLAGYYLSLHYLDFLMLVGGAEFGKADPIFGHDIGFYVFTLPNLWLIWWAALWCALAGLVSSISWARRAM